MVKSISITDPFTIIHFVSIVLASVGAYLVLGELPALLSNDKNGLHRLLYTPEFRWSALSSAVVAWINFVATWLEQPSIFVVTGGILWWSLPSMITLLSSGLVAGPILVLLGSLSSFAAIIKILPSLLQAEPLDKENEVVTPTETPTDEPSSASGSVTPGDIVIPTPNPIIFYVSISVFFLVGAITLLATYTSVFSAATPLPKIEYDWADRWIFTLMQSLFTLVFVAVRFIKLKNPGPLSYALLGYMASSSLGYTLRADYVAARAGGFFLFFSCVAFISLLLWNRLNFTGAVMELKSNLPLHLPLLACLALIGFLMYSIVLTTISAVWTALCGLLIVLVNILCILSKQSDLFWLTWGASINNITFLLFIPSLRGDAVGLVAACLLIAAQLGSFSSVRTLSWNVRGGSLLTFAPLILVLVFGFVGIFVGTSIIALLHVGIMSSSFILHAYLDISGSHLVSLHFLGTIFGISCEYWSPTKDGSDVGAAIVAVAFLLLSCAMVAILVLRQKSSGPSEQTPLTAPKSETPDASITDSEVVPLE